MSIRHKNKWLQVEISPLNTEPLFGEILKSSEKHGGFNSMHELYGVLKEEMDEFWDSVKDNDPDPEELLQIAAVAYRGFMQLCEQGQAEMAEESPHLFKVNKAE